MPIRNKPGFVPKSERHQPLFYVDMFNRVSAVYRHPHTSATIYLEVDAHTWDCNSMFDATGDLVILYQASDGRRTMSTHKTLKAALAALNRILDKENFGKGLRSAPVNRPDNDFGPRWPNQNLIETPRKFRRKGNGKRFRLTEAHKAILKESGTREQDFPWLEEAANRGTFVLNETSPEAHAINAWEALELLGERTFLSGLDHATGHWTCDRETPDGEHTVSFDMSIIHKA